MQIIDESLAAEVKALFNKYNYALVITADYIIVGDRKTDRWVTYFEDEGSKKENRNKRLQKMQVQSSGAEKRT